MSLSKSTVVDMSKRKTQTILIPKGTINPNEDTLIEIPTDLKGQPLVVATSPGGTDKVVDIERSSLEVKTNDQEQIKVVSERERRYFDDLAKSHRRSSTSADQPVTPRSSNGTTTIDKSSASPKPSSKSLSGERKKSHQDTSFILPPKKSTCQSTSCSSLNPKESTKKIPSKDSCACSDQSQDLSYSDFVRQRSAVIQKRPGSSPVFPFARLPQDQPTTKRCGSKTNNICIRRCMKCCQEAKSKPKLDKEIQAKIPKKRPEPPMKKCDSPKCEVQSLRSRSKSPDDMSDIYFERLKRQFDEARRKLEEAVLLAAISLREVKGKQTELSMSKHSMQSVCQCVPEKDTSSSKPSYINCPQIDDALKEKRTATVLSQPVSELDIDDDMMVSSSIKPGSLSGKSSEKDKCSGGCSPDKWSVDEFPYK